MVNWFLASFEVTKTLAEVERQFLSLVFFCGETILSKKIAGMWLRIALWLVVVEDVRIVDATLGQPGVVVDCWGRQQPDSFLVHKAKAQLFRIVRVHFYNFYEFFK